MKRTIRNQDWAKIGRAIRDRRLQMGLTQTALGALIDRQTSAISRLESGARYYDDRTMERIAQALETTVENLGYVPTGADETSKPESAVEGIYFDANTLDGQIVHVHLYSVADAARLTHRTARAINGVAQRHQLGQTLGNARFYTAQDIERIREIPPIGGTPRNQRTAEELEAAYTRAAAMKRDWSRKKK